MSRARLVAQASSSPPAPARRARRALANGRVEGRVLHDQALRALPSWPLPGVPNQNSSAASASFAVGSLMRLGRQAARVDLDRAVAVGDPDDAVLPVDLELHVALREQGELPSLLGRHEPRVDVAGACHARRQAGPPGRCAMAEGVDADPIGAAARLDERRSSGWPTSIQWTRRPVRPLCQVRLPRARTSLGSSSVPAWLVGRHVEREGEEADHHPLCRSRRDGARG